ncbi:MAG: hypothetical protein KDA27_28205 [Candidatus Eisenbacteria bacterium]|uniref:Transposase n=1 Tax=Eiseniibacteriota bacterium TaxID=2212470 RepID=A0A956SIM6_UNCEI|nr:hypothetical protein [Candidatus Eisenbacteria bacterium]
MSRLKEMRTVLSRWRRSGLSLRRFGQDQGISYNTLQYWRRKFEGTGPVRRQGRQATPEFVPVEVVPDRTTEKVRYDVRLRSGHRVRVHSGFDAAELRRLVEALESC